MKLKINLKNKYLIPTILILVSLVLVYVIMRICNKYKLSYLREHIGIYDGDSINFYKLEDNLIFKDEKYPDNEKDNDKLKVVNNEQNNMDITDKNCSDFSCGPESQLKPNASDINCPEGICSLDMCCEGAEFKSTIPDIDNDDNDNDNNDNNNNNNNDNSLLDLPEKPESETEEPEEPKKIQVQRTDSHSGWGQQLKFKCGDREINVGNSDTNIARIEDKWDESCPKTLTNSQTTTPNKNPNWSDTFNVTPYDENTPIPNPPPEKCESPVILYEHNNFSGKASRFNKGEYDFPEFIKKAGNDTISSLEVPKGCKVELYQHSGFGGWKTTFEPGKYNMDQMIAKGAKNDDASSIKVMDNTSAPEYTMNDSLCDNETTINSKEECQKAYDYLNRDNNFHTPGYSKKRDLFDLPQDYGGVPKGCSIQWEGEYVELNKDQTPHFLSLDKESSNNRLGEFKTICSSKPLNK